MDKLTLGELSAYLPWELNFMAKGEKWQMTKIDNLSTYPVWACVKWDSRNRVYTPEINNRDLYIGKGFKLKEVKPLLRSLSQLTQEIEHKGESFLPYQRIYQFASNMGIHKRTFEHMLNSIIDGNTHITELPYYLVIKLHEWHFDTANLLGRGLAVEIKEGA